MKLSDSLLVSKASGSSRKYCFTMSATSYAWWFSNFTLSGSASASCLRRCIRDLTPGFRNNPTWSRALSSSHRKPDWMNGGNAEPFFWTFVISGTPKTVLSAKKKKKEKGNCKTYLRKFLLRNSNKYSVVITIIRSLFVTQSPTEHRRAPFIVVHYEFTNFNYRFLFLFFKLFNWRGTVQNCGVPGSDLKLNADVPLGSGIFVLRINFGNSQFHPVRWVGQYRSMMAVSLRRANFRSTNSWPTVSDWTICPSTNEFGRHFVFWKLCHRTTDPLYAQYKNVSALVWTRFGRERFKWKSHFDFRVSCSWSLSCTTLDTESMLSLSAQNDVQTFLYVMLWGVNSSNTTYTESRNMHNIEEWLKKHY